MRTRHDGSGSRAGFTLIEVMVAMVVMAIAILGTMGGLTQAQALFVSGQLLQVRMALVEAKGQKLLLANKTTLAANAVAYPSTAPAQLAIGASPWVVDPSNPGDPGGGAYFKLGPDGSVTAVASVTAGTPCSSTSLPGGTFCREVLTTVGTPTGTAGPNGTTVYTQWYRLVKAGDPAGKALVYTEVFSQ